MLPLVIDPTYSLVYSTYLGGSGDEIGYGIAVDGSGSAYVSGFTSATNFPTKAPLQTSNHGAEDVFVTKLNAAGSLLVYSTYLGGGVNDAATGIALYTNPLGKTFAFVTGFHSIDQLSDDLGRLADLVKRRAKCLRGRIE